MSDIEAANILIVDDEKDIQEMLSRHFRFLGYKVQTASNGKEALNVLKGSRMEVVVSDIKMPVMDGIELLHTIRTHYPTTRVVIMTGYVTLENLLAAFRYGAETCVYKPLKDLGELEDAVAHAVQHLRTWQAKLKALKSLGDETETV